MLLVMQAQRLIAICGWEPRLLPYTVDCEDQSGAQSVNGHVAKSRKSGPNVVMHSHENQPSEVKESQVSTMKSASCDPASAVFDCSLCGASVGLWSFTTVDRPAPLLISGLADLGEKKSLETGIAKPSAASCIDGGGLAGPEVADEPNLDVAEPAPLSVLEKPVPQKGVLDLKLTIAGGPPPTRLAAPALVPPTFGIPGMSPTGGQSKRIEPEEFPASSNGSQGPVERGAGQAGSALETNPEDRPLVADSVEGSVLGLREAEDVEFKDAEHSSKRKRETSTFGRDQTENFPLPRISKRQREAGMRGLGGSMRRPTRDLPHASSVNAIDTCFLQKQENSMESVDNLPQESDGQGTTTGEDHGDGIETVVQAEHSRYHEGGFEADMSKSDEGGGEEDVETNLAVLSNGTATGAGGVSAGMGGAGSVGMGGSREAEVQGDIDLERTDSVAEFVTDVTGLMEEFIPGRDLMDESVPDVTGKMDMRDGRGDSHEAMLNARHPLFKDSSSAGGSERSQGKGSHRRTDEVTDREGTLDTTVAVIEGDVADASVQVNEDSGGHMDGESPVQRNEEVQSPAHFPRGIYILCSERHVHDISQFDLCVSSHGVSLVKSRKSVFKVSIGSVFRYLLESMSPCILWEDDKSKWSCSGLPMEDVRKWETETGEFDPILQHRHFCPWVNGHVAGAGSGLGSLCGWQVTLDALQQKHTPTCMVESESAASKLKVK